MRMRAKSSYPAPVVRLPTPPSTSLAKRLLPGYFFMEASLKGLNGGHSGDDINKKRANAIKILARFLFLENEKLDGSLRLVSFNSGEIRQCHSSRRKDCFRRQEC